MSNITEHIHNFKIENRVNELLDLEAQECGISYPANVNFIHADVTGTHTVIAVKRADNSEGVYRYDEKTDTLTCTYDSENDKFGLDN